MVTDRLLVKEEITQSLVSLGELFNQLGTLLLGQSPDGLGDLIRLDDIDTAISTIYGCNLPLDTLVVDGLHSHEIHNTLEIGFGTDRNLHGRSVHLELGTELADNAEGVGTGTAESVFVHRYCSHLPVHLVDECKSRNVVTTHLTVDGNRLTLRGVSRGRMEDGDGPGLH